MNRNLLISGLILLLLGIPVVIGVPLCPESGRQGKTWQIPRGRSLRVWVLPYPAGGC